MAIIGLRDFADFADGLNASSAFRGRATWSSERAVDRRETLFSYQCTRRTPVFSVSDRLLEDANDAAAFVITQAWEIYKQAHANIPIVGSGLVSIWTCDHCRRFVTFPNESRMSSQQLYEHCEGQAVKWMTRMKAVEPPLAT